MTTSFKTAIDMIAAPGAAFARLRDTPTILFPLLIVVTLNVAVAAWYIAGVDVPWMLEMQLEGQAQGATPEQREQMLRATESVSPAVIMVSSSVSAGIAVLVLLFLPAVYFVFVSMITNDGFGLRQWFSLVCWTALPTVLAQLATAVNLLVSEVSRLPPTSLNPLSFANLLGIEPGRAASEQFVMNMDPTSIWALVLLVLGYQAWTRRSIGVAAAIVMAPIALVVAAVLLI